MAGFPNRTISAPRHVIALSATVVVGLTLASARADADTLPPIFLSGHQFAGASATITRYGASGQSSDVPVTGTLPGIWSNRAGAPNTAGLGAVPDGSFTSGITQASLDPDPSLFVGITMHAGTGSFTSGDPVENLAITDSDATAKLAFPPSSIIRLRLLARPAL